MPYLNEPQCASPAPRMTGKAFSHLRLDEFACPPELLTRPKFVQANSGNDNTTAPLSFAVLRVVVYSSPHDFFGGGGGRIMLYHFSVLKV